MINKSSHDMAFEDSSGKNYGDPEKPQASPVEKKPTENTLPKKTLDILKLIKFDPEKPDTPEKITLTPDGFNVEIEHINLEPDESVDYKVEIEKFSVPLRDGDEVNDIMIDLNHPAVQAYLNDPELIALEDLPDKEQAIRLIDYVRTKIKYAYPENMSNLDLFDSKKADWVKTKIIDMDIVNISEILSETNTPELGHAIGVCRHFAVLYKLAADRLGRQTTLGIGDGLKNVYNPKTGKTIFRNGKQDQLMVNHLWIEDFDAEHNQWVPIDPTINLNGYQDKDTMEKARYYEFLETGPCHNFGQATWFKIEQSKKLEADFIPEKTKYPDLYIKIQSKDKAGYEGPLNIESHQFDGLYDWRFMGIKPKNIKPMGKNKNLDRASL